MSIYLTAIVKSTEEGSDELRRILQNMVLQSRKEEVCIQYDLHEDQETQTFIFHEEWADQPGLDAHNQKPYITDFVTAAKRLTSSVTLYKTVRLA